MSSVNKTQVRGKQLEADEAVRTERAGIGSGEEEGKKGMIFRFLTTENIHD